MSSTSKRHVTAAAARAFPSILPLPRLCTFRAEDRDGRCFAEMSALSGDAVRVLCSDGLQGLYAALHLFVAHDGQISGHMSPDRIPLTSLTAFPLRLVFDDFAVTLLLEVDHGSWDWMFDMSPHDSSVREQRPQLRRVPTVRQVSLLLAAWSQLEDFFQNCDRDQPRSAYLRHTHITRTVRIGALSRTMSDGRCRTQREPDRFKPY